MVFPMIFLLSFIFVSTTARPNGFQSQAGFPSGFPSAGNGNGQAGFPSGGFPGGQSGSPKFFFGNDNFENF